MKKAIAVPSCISYVKEPMVWEEEEVVLRGPQDIATYMGFMEEVAVEEFYVLTMNTRGRVTGKLMVSRGGLASTVVEPRQVYGFALRMGAATICCVHNHPSGNPEPSAEDIAVTRQLVEAGRVLGIPLRDHVIIAGPSGTGWTSLAERGAI